MVKTVTQANTNNTSNASTTNTATTISGDVNGNGGLDASDYVLIKNHIMGKTKLTSEQIKVGDMNGNGGLDASDYVLIKKKLMN